MSEKRCDMIWAYSSDARRYPQETQTKNFNTGVENLVFSPRTGASSMLLALTFVLVEISIQVKAVANTRTLPTRAKRPISQSIPFSNGGLVLLLH